MSLFRVEYDVKTGERKEILQAAYSDGNEIIVLDKNCDPPDGFYLKSDDEVS